MVNIRCSDGGKESCKGETEYQHHGCKGYRPGNIKMQSAVERAVEVTRTSSKVWRGDLQQTPQIVWQYFRSAPSTVVGAIS